MRQSLLLLACSTLAAIAVGAAPDGYAETEAARKGMAALRRYFQKHPPTMLHQQAMLLWAASYQEDLIKPEVRRAWIEQLLGLQKDDGGWSTATMGDWQRRDGQPQDTATSDGYGTGFAIYVLRQAGLPAADPQIQRGLGWLKTHQRASGRWFTRSLNKDNKHYLTHAGTAMAVLALAACGERAAPVGN
jgi:squalene-hopene/tetraprenyl-beta-curcumene cyclase